MQILGLLGIYFDAVVVEIEKSLLSTHFIQTAFASFMKGGLKGGISIDADFWPLGYVL